jgi:hypothetical protein
MKAIVISWKTMKPAGLTGYTSMGLVSRELIDSCTVPNYLTLLDNPHTIYQKQRVRLYSRQDTLPYLPILRV